MQKNYVKKCCDVMQEQSDRAPRWKDTVMTLCAYGNLLLRSGHVLLTHICCSHTLRVGALSRTSMLTLTAKTLSEGAVVHSRVGNTHTGAYSHRGFLTFTSCVSGMPLYGQNDQYLRHVLSQAFFQTFPPSWLLLETQSRGLGAHASLL